MPDQSQTAPPKDDRSFAAFLQQLEDGGFADHLTDQLRALVAALHAQQRDAGGKPSGRIALTIAMKLDGGIFEVVAQSTLTPPKPVRPRSIFYRTTDDLLSANNPKQLELGVTAVRDVSASSATNIRALR